MTDDPYAKPQRPLFATSLACVAVPALWMLRSQPTTMAGPMFTAALLALAVIVTAVLAGPSCDARPARFDVLDVALGLLVGGLLVQWIGGRLAFAAQALQPLAALGLAWGLKRAIGPLGERERTQCARGMAWGLVSAGAWNCVVALLQLIELDGLFDCCMMVDLTGSVSGNFQQRNHFASYMVWALLAVLWLQHAGEVRARTALRLAAVFGAVVGLTGSRVGVLELLALGIAAGTWWWRGRGDGSAAIAAGRGARVALMAFGSAVALALLKPVLGQWLGLPQEDLVARSTGNDPSMRAHMWGAVWQLIKLHPWQGVGWDQLGYALLAEPGLPLQLESVHNAHDLPLQLIATLGVPLGLGITLALLVYVVIGTRMVWRGASATTAFGVAGLFTIGMHSVVEYPLWYHYLLVPAALFAALAAVPSGVAEWSLAPIKPAKSRQWAWASMVALAMMLWIHALHDYMLVARAFSVDRGSSTEPIDRAYAQCVWFEPPAVFANIFLLPRDAAGEVRLHRDAGRVLKVQVQPVLLVSEIAWYERQGDRPRAERYARYLGSVFYNAGDPGAAIADAARTLQRPGLVELAAIARYEAVRRWTAIGRPVPDVLRRP